MVFIKVYYKSVELKINTDGGYQLTKGVSHYLFLTKKNCQLKSSAMARNTFNICRAR